MSCWTDELRHKPPRRRYPFWARRDRRRTAQALASGRSAADVATLNRVPLREVESLLRDREFAALLAHYREVAALPRAARLERLAGMALEMLELAVETGDMRVCMFVLDEQRAGRDPALSIAEQAVRMSEEAGLDQPRPSRPRAPAPPGEKPYNEWQHCAATKVTPEDAEELAVMEGRRQAGQLRRTLARLARRLMAEAEREGAVQPWRPVAALEEAGRKVARFYHERPAQCLNAAERLARRRRDAGAGRLPGHDPPD